MRIACWQRLVSFFITGLRQMIAFSLLLLLDVHPGRAFIVHGETLPALVAAFRLMMALGCLRTFIVSRVLVFVFQADSRVLQSMDEALLEFSAFLDLVQAHLAHWLQARSVHICEERWLLACVDRRLNLVAVVFGLLFVA